jgi:ABC-type multidrug transport system fused ATPase/permease subunit
MILRKRDFTGPPAPGALVCSRLLPSMFFKACRSYWQTSLASWRLSSTASCGASVSDLSLALWWQFCKRWGASTHSSQSSLMRPHMPYPFKPHRFMQTPQGSLHSNTPFFPAEVSASLSLRSTADFPTPSLFGSTANSSTSRTFGSTAASSSWFQSLRSSETTHSADSEPSDIPMEPLPIWRDASYFGNSGIPPPPKLMASQLACIRGGEVIFRDINLSLHCGSAVNMTGPNGSGKTSMLRVVSTAGPFTALTCTFSSHFG